MAKKNKTRRLEYRGTEPQGAHNYFIEENLEAGIMLTGTEVKSSRNGRSSIEESYAADQRVNCSWSTPIFPNMTQAPQST